MTLALDEEYLKRQIKFSTQTFGPGSRFEGVIDHIRKELLELEEEPDDISEWADVIILAFDGAWRQGFSESEIIQAVHDKLAKNESRTWPDWRKAAFGKAIEHDRNYDD